MSNSLLEQAIASLAIRDVYLKSVETHVAEDFEPTEYIPLSVQFRHTAKGATLFTTEEDDAQGSKNRQDFIRIHIETGMRLITGEISKSEHSSLDESTMAEISASFVAEYLVISESIPSNEALETFGKQNALYHVWPYWREFIQSMCARLRLPSVVIPMYRIPKQEGAQTKKMKPTKTDKKVK